jgi:endonuclease/exonuclease/phosphatase family metal-dependent hydrolase
MEVNVLSYNVSWEAMSDGLKGIGTVSGSIRCNPEKCLKNVSRLIKDNIIRNNINIIGIQETNILEKELKGIENFDYIPWIESTTTSTTTYISILYNNIIFSNITEKYFNLNDGQIKHIKGKFDDSNPKAVRAFQIVVLKQNITNDEILYINLHNNHEHKIDGSIKKIIDILEIQKKNNGHKNIKKIIITGDFNHNIDKNISFLDKELNYHNKTFNTCCDSTLNTNTMDKRYDNILSYGFDLKEIFLPIKEPENILYSDHLPIIVKLSYPIKDKIRELLIELVNKTSAKNKINDKTPETELVNKIKILLN